MILSFSSGISAYRIIRATPISKVSDPLPLFTHAQVTQAPAVEDVEKQLAKRAFTSCTQWSVVGGGYQNAISFNIRIIAQKHSWWTWLLNRNMHLCEYIWSGL